ncbi:MAG: carboxypeptidase-like regulatory domain-containing protein, partial [Flavisolibacter sp.]
MRDFFQLQTKKFKSVMLFTLFNLFVLAAAAQVRISGKVTNQENKGIADISVLVRGTTFGTTTNVDGNYSFQADLKPGTYQINFSGIGFKEFSRSIEVSSNNAVTADVQMAEDALKMDEVVITGVSAGTTRRQLGNYIASVNAEDLNKGATGNVLAALQGKTAGAQISQNSGDPAGGMSVRLRGISSILSSSEPLYIVDGVIINNATTRVTNTQNNYDGNNFVGTIGQNRMVDINP